MSFSPVLASQHIDEKYKRYLSTIFTIADNGYAVQFNQLLGNKQSFARGPYLDVTDSFVKGKSISELINDEILTPGFRKVNLPQARPLYKHQEMAILKVCKGKNLVVSTGTGSGKTESFLIPILNQILKESDEGVLTSGVRALLIYPMNALANDQVERLRTILSQTPEITFGCYTGQTREKYEDALIEYKSLNNGAVPLINELICRKQMKQTPPHILITNYAMLEYLMLRPDDSVFFSVEYAEKWKYIVLDEAHVYTGSTGIEVSMLLRRLKAKLNNPDIRYILTSATLGNENQNDEVARFAENLCDSHFALVDVVRAVRVTHKQERTTVCLGHGFYDEIATKIDNGVQESEIIDYILCTLKIPVKSNSLEELLYDLVLHDELYWKMREILQCPRTVDEVSRLLEWSSTQVANFVTVASKCEKNGDKLFDARYHMFLRATESVFITLNPSNKLFLTRKEFHEENDGCLYKTFEIATCSSCHAIYLIGKIEGSFFVQSANFIEPAQKTMFLLSDNISDTDEDHTLENEQIMADMYEICSRCGYIFKTGSPEINRCDHGKQYYVKVIKVSVKNETGKLTKCLSCENTNNYGMLRTFFTGQEAVTSVIGTALFEELPSYKIVHEVRQADDDCGFGTTTESAYAHKTKEAKQYIAFSDSRQAAAFFASYFDQTYRNILYKRLVAETLAMNNSRGENQLQSAVDFVEDLIWQFEKHCIADKNHDQTRKEAWKAILHEIVDNNGTTSLSCMGILGLAVNDTGIVANTKYNLSHQEVATLCNVFASGMMADAAIVYNVPLNKADKEFFTHAGVEYSYSLSDSNSKSYRRSFIPTKVNMKNKRVDYLLRVLERKGFNIDIDQAVKLLTAFWTRFFESNQIVKAVDGAYKIDVEKIMITRNAKWYICDKCKKITIHNIENVCPAYKCNGSLHLIDPDSWFKENHYYQMYRNLEIREMKVVEHTAQLDKDTAYNYQKQFQRKEIDILSCSTTFEMGVDVGTLETVFMRNMPPSPANYAQRAGRAGRNKNSAAFALTFCNKSNHDFSFFSSPEKMIRGKINPPKFNVENDKIAIRHLYASALSYFWKSHSEYFSNAVDFTEVKKYTVSGYECFEEYLHTNPEDLKVYCAKFLPPALAIKFGVESFAWIAGLINNNEEKLGVLTKALSEYSYEVGVLQEAMNRAKETENYQQLHYLSSRKKVYESEDILSFLSRKNVLPKYGFPVDTVEMNIADTSSKNKLGLQLQRDLQMAISEYAPGSQIVANGSLITSRYIRKIPTMTWKMYDYISCNKCQTINIEPHTDEDEFSRLCSCRQCETAFTTSKRKTFLIPSFGFEADGDKIEKPGLIRPEKTYRSETAYVGNKSIAPILMQIGNADIELILSNSDEMVVLNESNFFVCEYCGFTDLDEKCPFRFKKMAHKTSTGYRCKNNGQNQLKKFHLGYRFETDVVQLRFLNPDLVEWECSITVLYALLKGISMYLNIEQNDIAGCLQYFYNTGSKRANYALVLYDKTPGGAGHVRQLNNQEVLEGIVRESLNLMNNCSCGGETKDSSCYSCLRNYYNQKHHDILKRKYAIEFLSGLFEINQQK